MLPRRPILICLFILTTWTMACSGTEPQSDFASVSGTLTLDGNPASDVRVCVLGAPQLDDRTDQNGAFKIAGLLPGLHVLIASDGKGHGLRIEVEVAPGEERRLGALAMDYSGAIAGMVILEGGGDATGTDAYVPGTSYLAKTDVAGNFMIFQVPPGTFTVRADRAGYISAKSQVVVPVGGVGEVTLNLDLGCRPSAEVCNGQDDDCDGITDEEGVCTGQSFLDMEPDYVDFGNVLTGDSVSRSAYILCVGDRDIMVEEISLSPGSEQAFSLSSPTLPVLLAPGKSLEVVVAFTPTSAFYHDGVILVSGSGLTATVRLSGFGCQPGTEVEVCNDIDDDCDGQTDEGCPVEVPDIEVIPAQIDFGNVAVGSQATDTVEIRNVGTVDSVLVLYNMYITIESDPAYHLSNQPVLPTVITGSAVILTFDVSFSPTATGSHTATVHIESNDPDEPVFLLTVTGAGIGL